MVVLAQAFDVATTLYGLRRANVVEQNPVPAAAVEALGALPGLLVVAVLGVGVVVAVTELGVRTLSTPTLSPGRLRVLGYAPFAALSLLAGANNLLVASVA